MKTAISLPDRVFEDAERHARRTKKSRSRLYTQALSEYLARHSPDKVTESLDRICDELGQEPDSFLAAASRKILEQTQW